MLNAIARFIRRKLRHPNHVPTQELDRRDREQIAARLMARYHNPA